MHNLRETNLSLEMVYYYPNMHGMDMHKGDMTNQSRCPSLEKVLPEGLLVNRDWLYAKGFTRPAIDYYLRTETLVAVARGIYRQPGPPLKWQHVAYSLQVLGYGLHVGGRTALELQGLAHDLPAHGISTIWLYGAGRLPAWANKADSGYLFVQGRSSMFVQWPDDALTTLPFGHWDWPLRCSKPELALLEILGNVSTTADFEAADHLFESASTLRPRVVMNLLMACRQVKAKRLFLWFSERHGHAWFHKLDTGKLDLGSGKRQIIQGGSLVVRYQITVPREMADGS